MPFGFTNAPATFFGLVDALFGPEFKHNVFADLDDIIIYSERDLRGALAMAQIRAGSTGGRKLEGKSREIRILLLARNLLGVPARHRGVTA